MSLTLINSDNDRSPAPVSKILSGCGIKPQQSPHATPSWLDAGCHHLGIYQDNVKIFGGTLGWWTDAGHGTTDQIPGAEIARHCAPGT